MSNILFKETVQFIQSEVKYNYNNLLNDSQLVNETELTAKISELRNDLNNINSQVTAQNTLLQALQVQLNNLQS